MGLFALLNHLVNLLAPALAVGALLPLLARLVRQGNAVRRSWLRQSALNALAGVAALLGGLVYFGHDDKMASYGAMLLACATVQFVSARAWKR